MLQLALDEDDAAFGGDQEVVGIAGRVRQLDADCACLVKDRLDFGNRQNALCTVYQVTDKCFVVMAEITGGVAQRLQLNGGILGLKGAKIYWSAMSEAWAK